MQKQFTKFSENIRLTSGQIEDAQVKYRNVCKSLHKSYYESEYNGKTKLLFGSYKTKTNTRPLSKDQDVDLIFKIPKETYEKYVAYENNGPSGLLQEIKQHLQKSFPNSTIKAWGKIIFVQFADNTHNIEVVPAFELEDGTFKIPNSSDGGSWEDFNPREQLNHFQLSNDKTNGLTADLSRIMKTWIQNTSTLDYKSYTLLNDIIQFLETDYKEGAVYANYPSVVRDCFEYLKNSTADYDTHLKSALERSEKAIQFIGEEKLKEASIEWRKIFGNQFPAISENAVTESKARVFSSPSSPYASYKID